MKKKPIIYLILMGTVLFFLLAPSVSHAFVGTGIFDFFDTALSGIEELASPVSRNIIKVLFLYAIGFLFLMISGRFLDFLIASPELINISNNETIVAGWNFCCGMANLMLIIVFIVVAISFILKIESLGTKKVLSNLIIVALLVNFSFLFVGALIDISTIITNSIAQMGASNLTSDDGIGFAQHISSTVLDGGLNVIQQLITWIGLLAVAYLAPMFSPFAQYGLVVALGVTMFPNLLVWGCQIIIFYMLGGIFLLYGILLLIRIFMVQLLAVVSPLAFVCTILPQTKKYWDTWFNTLTQWLFFAIPLLFFLLIGTKILKAYSFPTPTTVDTYLNLIGGNADGVFEFFFFYFFLIIFLITAVILSKKLMPANASEMINELSGVTKRFMAPAQKTIGAINKNLIEEHGYKEREKAHNERVAGYEEIARRKEMGEPIPADSLSVNERIGRWAYDRKKGMVEKAENARWVGGAIKKTGDAIIKKESNTAAASLAKEVSAKQKEFTHTSPDEFTKNYGNYSNTEKLALLRGLSDEHGSDSISKLSDDQKENLIKTVSVYGGSSEKKILGRMILGADNDKNEETLQKIGVKIGENGESRVQALISGTKGKSCATINKEAFDNSDNIKSALMSWGAGDVNKSLEKTNDVVDKFNVELSNMNEQEREALRMKNPKLYKSIIGKGAGALTFGDFENSGNNNKPSTPPTPVTPQKRKRIPQIAPRRPSPKGPVRAGD